MYVCVRVCVCVCVFVCVSQEQAVLRLKRHKLKYAFTDHFRGLRGADVTLNLYYSVMPYVGE